MKTIYGYCGMTADFLHIGHINLLKECRKKCDYLVVGIMSDECVKEYKGHYPLMDQNSRVEIVQNLSLVDFVVIQKTFEYPQEIIDDEEIIIFDSPEHKRKGADIIIPRTEGVSSTQFRERANENINNSQFAL